MADYKNFFDTNNPLNLYTVPKPAPFLDGAGRNYNSPVNQETEEQKAARLKQEEEEKRRLQYQQEQARLDANKKLSTDFVSNLSTALKTGKGADSVWENTINGVDLETGKLNHPFLSLQSQVGDFIKDYKEQEKQKQFYNGFSKDVTNVVQDVLQLIDNDSQETSLSAYKDEVSNALVEVGNYKTKEEADADWEFATPHDKNVVTIAVLGKKYFSNNKEALDKFLSLDDKGRLAMLVSAMKSSPYYESENSKYEKELDLAAQDIAGPLLKQLEDLQQWGESLSDDTDDIVKDGGLLINSILKGTRNFFGEAASLAGGMLHGLTSLSTSGIKSLYGEFTNSKEERTDAEVDRLDKLFIEQESEALKQEYLSMPLDQKRALADEFDAISESSQTYKQAKDTDLVKLLGDDATPEQEIDAKVEELAELHTRAAIYGEDAAVKSLDDFWKDTTAQNQGALDYIRNTAGVGTTSLVSDLLSAAAVATNVFNPYMYGYNAESSNDMGYSDALIKHNVIMDWAEQVQQYGEEKFHTYKTAEEENSFINWRDVPDLIGQYGFTVASKWISVAGSKAARKLSTYAAKKALEQGVKGSAVRGLVFHKELRDAIKAGIKAGEGTEEYTKALEVINQLQSKRMYNLNLAVEAAVGTAEGALEAKQTYKKFIEDNNVEAYYDERNSQIENATEAELRQYMISSNYQPAYLSTNNETGSAVAEFSPEQYEQARQELIQKNQELKARAIERREDDALDAAAANFIGNSFINGAANIMLKESLLSDDVKNASRRMKGQTKGVTDLIDITKDTKGWVARVKDGLKDKDKNIWRKIGAGAKSASKIALNASKSAFGEMAEEYGQNVSDDISRAALQSDLNRYISTVYDDQSHEAFNTDLLNILNTGLGSISTSMTNKEAIKAGVFGFISTLGGGIDYGNVVAGLGTLTQSSEAERGTKQWFKDKGKNIANYLGGLYQGAAIQAYRESKEEGESAQRLAETVNEWLNNKNNQELLTHLGGAIGFKKLLENDLISRDSQAARDDKLSLAVENAFMLRALEGTTVADAYNKEINDHIALAELTSQENRADNFDEAGNYIGTNQQASSAIAAFKEQVGQAKDNMTDLQIISRMAQNAQEFRELQQKIDTYSRQVENMYHEDNLDPIVQQAYVQAMIQQDKARSRQKSLKQRLESIFDLSNPNLSDKDKELIESKSDLDKMTISLLSEYGSIKNAEKALDKINEEINEVNTALGETKNKKQSTEENNQNPENRKILKRREKNLQRQAVLLEMQIAQVKDAAIERANSKKNQAKQETQVQSTEGTKEQSTEVSQEKETKQSIPEEIFTVGDMVAMSSRQRSEILNNRKSFSSEQQDQIDKFLTLSAKLLARQTPSSEEGDADSMDTVDDIALTDEEVIADYTDLAALESKVDAYDNYLYSYIQNPRFLTAAAQNLRQDQRRKTLKFYYKDDLRVRPDETTLDMMDRVREKIDILKQLGKHEDAAILESIVNDDPVLKKMHNALKETEIRVAASVAYSPAWKGKDKEADQALTALRTIISGSGMSLKEIKALLDNNDIEGIKSQLLKKHKGKYLLNTQLENSRQQAILKESANPNNEDSENTAVLLPLIQNIKNVLDLYYSKEKLEQTKGKSQEVTPQTQKERKQEEATQAPKPKQTKKENETSIIKIIVPSDIDINSSNQKKQQLRYLLDRHGVNRALHRMGKPDTVKFMVLNKPGGESTIFVVVPVKNAVRNKQGNGFETININGTNYQIIGCLNEGDSSTLESIAEQHRKDLPQNGARILKDGRKDIEFEVNQFGPAKFTSNESLDPNNPPALRDHLQGEDLNSWVEDFVEKGQVEEGTDNEGYYRVTFYAQGYPVTMQKSEGKVTSLFSIPLEGLKLEDGTVIPSTTIGAFIKDPNYSAKQKIQALTKHDSFFATLFDTWSGYINTRAASSKKDWSNFAIYKHLLGNFIYLGHPEDSSGSNRGLLHPQVDGAAGILTLDSYTDPNVKVAINIPNGTTNNPEELALAALSTIIDAVNEGKLLYHNPTINKDAIGTKGTMPQQKAQEKGILKGLVQLGVLQAFLPQAVSRTILIQNKYAKKAQSVNDNNPNLVTPDNSKSEAAKQPMKDKVIKELSEGQKKAKAIVDKIIEASDAVKLEEDEKDESKQGTSTPNDDTDDSSYYKKGNRKLARVTATEVAARGHNKGAVNITGNRKVTSTSQGNTADAIVRTVIEILNKSTKLYGKNNAELLYEELIKNGPFKGKIPNYTKRNLKPFLEDLIEFYNIAYDNGWTIVPNDIKAFGTLKVYEDERQVGVLPTAGTLDLLLYDENGDFFIVDIKTRHKTSQMQAWETTTAEGWVIQINDYQYLLEQQYGDIGMTFTGKNYVLSAAVDYSIPGTKVVQDPDDRMTIRYANGMVADITNGPTRVMRKENYSSLSVEHEMLVVIPQEDEEIRGKINLRNLPEKYKELVEPLNDTSDSESAPGTPFNFESGKQEGEESPAEEQKAGTSIDKDSEFKEENAAQPKSMKDFLAGRRKGKKSIKTVKQARFTDFINNHIAPLDTVKVNIIGKIKQKIAEFLDTRDSYQNLMMSDLANTFFQGNINQVKGILKGMKITPSNMPIITERLKRYFETYINNEDILIDKAYKRQKSYKALYDYLNGNITEAQFQEELYNLNIESKDLPELIDYINSTDKENTKRRILLKLDNSLIHQKEEADAIAETIRNRVENMRTKLEFLQTSSASSMLDRRLQSVKTAITEGKYSQPKTIDTRNSMQSILKGEDGLYGVDSLLTHIRNHSKNAFFRNLASTLQSYIKQYNLFITLSLDDQMLNVEGESKGRHITIYKNSIQSYEQLERVILHELLHSVLLVSPKIYNQLSVIIDKAIANIARSTGKSIAEIKKEHYGLTNADEFISEFFTNYAFQEMLKTVSDNENINMTDRIIERILKIFGKQDTIYSQAYKAITDLLRENSLESLQKTDEVIEDTPYIKHLFSGLDKSTQQMIKQKGISEDEFNDMTTIEQQHLEECCR